MSACTAKLLYVVVFCAAVACDTKDGHHSVPPKREAAAHSPVVTPSPSATTTDHIPPREPSSQPATTAPFAAAWSKASALELNSAAEAHASYLREEPDSFGELEGDNQRVRPTNCAQWADLHRRKYEATTRLEEIPDSGAKLRCTTLELIKSARAAERSYVRNLSWNQETLRILPVEVASAVHPNSERKIGEASAAGKTFAQFDPKARAKATGNETLEIIEGDRTTMIVLYPMAWGDFDGDGIDDMAMAVINGATKGTLSYTRLLVVTREGADHPMRLVSSH